MCIGSDPPPPPAQAPAPMPAPEIASPDSGNGAAATRKKKARGFKTLSGLTESAVGIMGLDKGGSSLSIPK